MRRRTTHPLDLPATESTAAGDPDQAPPRVLVLGIGNLLWADEGFGVRALETFDRRYCCPPEVTCMDGGTQGLYLLQPIREADILIVFDAVDMDRPPGALCILRDAEVPRYVSAKKMSLHQTGFQEVLGLASLLGDLPGSLVLIGVQPVALDDYGGSLRPAVKAQVGPAARLAAGYLAERGVRVTPRRVPAPDHVGPGCAVVTVDRYEQGRPSEQAACRFGDPRAWRPPPTRIS